MILHSTRFRSCCSVPGARDPLNPYLAPGRADRLGAAGKGPWDPGPNLGSGLRWTEVFRGTPHLS